VIQSSARLSTKRFLTVECGVLISSLEHFFLSDCFWQFFLFRASLFSPLKQIALVSFRSFLASGSFAFFLSKIINSGVFKQKLKRMPFPPLSLHEQRLAPMNAQKGKR